MPSSVRLERGFFAALTALAATIVAVTPVVPGHDVPQHLAYVRLLAAWRRDPASFPAVYDSPDLSSGYATTYAVLARLSQLVPPELALRGAVALYVVLLAVSVRALVHATWRVEGARAPLGPTSLVGPVVALNPVLCMGLLAYLFALPAVVAAFAAHVAHARTPQRRWLVLIVTLSGVAAALHSVAAAALALLSLAMLAARRDRRSALAFASCVAGALVGARLAGAGAKMPPGLGAMLLANVRRYGVEDGVIGTFRVTFTHWLEKLDQVMASVVGPFPLPLKGVAASVIAAVALADWRVRRGRRRSEGDPRARAVPGARVAVVALGVAAILAPAALQIPDDLSLLDFRLITTATLVSVILLPPGLLDPRRTLVAGVGGVLLLCLWARQLGGAAGEIMQTVRLVERLGPEDSVLALPMHDESAYMDERNEILHYAAVYHTARTGGVTSLFWGKFSPRLPVGYRTGQAPPAPADWSPWEMTEEQLLHYTHVVVRWPAPGEDERLLALARRIGALERAGSLRPLASDGACALFAVASSTGRSADRGSRSRLAGARVDGAPVALAARGVAEDLVRLLDHQHDLAHVRVEVEEAGR
jgi:hypothetical protein